MKKIMIAVMAVFLCACSSSQTKGCPVNMVQPSGERADMSAYDTLEDDEHVFYKKSMEEVVAMFEEKQSGIIYFGYPGCPWCEEALPVMNEVAKTKGLTICYAETYDGKEYQLKGETKDKIYSYLDAFLSEDDGEKVMYVPFVVVVKDGVAVAANAGTVESHDAHERKMNDSEIVELTNIYQDMFDQLGC